MGTASAWNFARRARQADIIRRTKPWTRSTGPRTAAGKAKSSMNAVLGPERARIRLLNEVLRLVTKDPYSPMLPVLWAEINRWSGEVNWEQVDADASMPWPETDDPFDYHDGDQFDHNHADHNHRRRRPEP